MTEYELNRQDARHHHVRCTRCDATIHFDAEEADVLLTRLAAGEGFKVSEIEVMVRGLCKGCQGKKARARR